MSSHATNRERDQLEIYARDLQKLSAQKRDASARIDSLAAQLDAYANDLKRAWESERVRTREIDEAYRGSLAWLARALNLRERETGEHAERLADYVGILCEALRLSHEEKMLFALAAPLHDLGKIVVPDSILLKPGPLNETELKLVRSHCRMGAVLLSGSSSPWLQTAHQVALTHHECWDGSGYPEGLRGEQIPLCGRIVKLADCYDVARSSRPHKGPIGAEQALRDLLQGNDRMQPEHFDPQLLELFEDVHVAFDEVFRTRGGR
jgi:putative two-component system response regulator